MVNRKQSSETISLTADPGAQVIWITAECSVSAEVTRLAQGWLRKAILSMGHPVSRRQRQLKWSEED